MKRLVLAAFVLALAVPSVAGADGALYSVASQDDLLREIDPADGSTIGSVTIAGSPSGGTGLAAHPATGELYASLKLGGSGRTLVIIDPADGSTTVIGDMGESVAGLAFDASGTLYAVTGDGSTTAESLFEVSLTDGSLTFLIALGAGSDGEMLGYNPVDGLLYHGSGHVGLCADDEVCYESIDPNNGFLVTNIDIEGSVLQDEETQALTWWSAGGVFLWKQDHGTGPLYHVNADGSNPVNVGEMDHQAKGLAFAKALPTPVEEKSWGEIKSRYGSGR